MYLYNFNPRPPRGGRLLVMGRRSTAQSFQSTPPARGATEIPVEVRPLFKISIHAPREGGDLKTGVTFARPSEFQSTPPARGATPERWD